MVIILGLKKKTENGYIRSFVFLSAACQPEKDICVNSPAPPGYIDSWGSRAQTRVGWCPQSPSFRHMSFLILSLVVAGGGTKDFFTSCNFHKFLEILFFIFPFSLCVWVTPGDHQILALWSQSCIGKIVFFVCVNTLLS